MTNIIRFLFITTLLSFVLAGTVFVHEYHYDRPDARNPELVSDIYDIIIKSQQDLDVTLPPLLDLSNYTTATMKAKLPKLSEGEINVMLLKEGYPKLRNQLAFFGDRQDRLDPLSIVISSGVVSLDDIFTTVNDTSLIEKKSDKSFILYAPLVLQQAATLIIQEGETLFMSEDKGAVLPLFGNLYVIDSTIIGWNTDEDQPAYFQSSEQFRPYIVAWCDSELNIANSYLGHLGYQYSKAYGLSYSSCESPLYVEDGVSLDSGTGWIVDSEFEQLYFGFYSYETDGVVIVNNKYKNNIVYGIDPHDYSKNLIIANNHIWGTQQKHGFIVSRGVTDSFIYNNISENNAGTGMMFDRHSANNIIAKNISRGNAGDGLTFYESSDNISFDNELTHNGGSGLRIRNSNNIRSLRDSINSNDGFAVEIYTQILKNRNLQKDPYEENAGLKIIDPEITANMRGLFKLDRIDYLDIIKPHIFDPKGAMLSGDINSRDYNLLHNNAALSITAKQN